MALYIARQRYCYLNTQGINDFGVWLQSCFLVLLLMAVRLAWVH